MAAEAGIVSGLDSPQGAIATNIAQIRDRIAAACKRAGRQQNSVQLMAVSKMHPAAALLEAAAAGITIFGENRVQEFATKKQELTGLAGVTISMIGHLQTNKARRAAELFDQIHSLDSLALAEKLNEAATALNKRLPVLLEIKLSHEAAKTGLLPNSPDLEALLERLPNLPALEMRGVMTVPPWDENAEAARPYFRQLRELRDQLAQQHPRLNFGDLSMGMTNDFEVAIEEGSTIVRVGTAIFGKRSYK
jgi:pyridoxal phosphate enzyme (YggS family)